MVRELYGLTLYRLGRWEEAITELEELRRLAVGDVTQLPVLADCYRAQGKLEKVEELWAELREVSPSSALTTEGRIVMAGALADAGRLHDGIRLLERGWRAPRVVRDHHVRRAYALADLYERAGSVPRAREMFRWVDSKSPGFADVVQRLSQLG